MSRLFVVGAVLAALAWAQSPRGSIIGRVTDASTSSLGGARVIIENTRTGSSSSVATAPEGEYTVPSLDPGVYRVTVSASGFKTKIMNEVVLNVSQTVRVDVVLDVGEITTKVEVTASVPVVQTDSSAVANVVDGRQVNAMPLNGRQNLYGLLALSPGVQGAGQNPLIAGSGGFGAVDLRIDGVSGNDHGNERNLQTVPSLESIAEFKVLANGGSAEFGRGGAQIIVATKGGTNEFHGSLIYFNRNRVTAANNFFSNRAGLPRPKFNRNEYGGSLGGPIRKNKLFFFGNFEGFRQTASATITTQMPTVALRNGDFTGLAQIRDPFNGGVPFPDNRIPPNRISSVPKGLDPFFSDPNTVTAAAAGLGNNFTTNVQALEPFDRYTGRIDYNISPQDRITGRYFRSANGPFNQTGGSSDKFGNWGGWGNDTHNVLASYTRVINPSVINEIRFGMQNNRWFRTPQNSDFDPSTLIPGLITPAEGLGGLPTVTILGFRGFLDQPGSGDRQATYEFTNLATWIYKKHSIKAGIEFQRPSSLNRQNTPPYRGQFSFDGRYSGHAFADYLLGAAYFTSRNTRNAVNESVNNRYFAYLQDDFNITPRLTLNLGVRYEYASPFKNSQGDISNFDPSTGQVVVVSGMENADPRLLSVLPIVDGQKSGIDTGNWVRPDRNNFAPRVGLAFRPLGTSRLVLRASYGIYYNAIAGYNLLLSQGVTNPPFRVQETFEPIPGSLPSLTWNNPFPGNGTIPTNPALIANARNRVNPYLQQWNFTIEQEVFRNTAVRVSYLGNKGTHLERDANINQPSMAPGAVQPRRPYQPWGPITYWESGRSSILHQLQFGVLRRYTSGFTLQFEYQFSKALNEQTFGTAPIDNQNFRYDRGNQDGIRRHYAVTNYIYDLPFGKGKRWLAGLSGPAEKIVSGWQVAGILTVGTGQPYSVSFTPTLQGWLAGRADYANPAAVVPDDPSINQWFNPAAFSVPQPFTFGNTARNAFFGPNIVAWDGAIFKNTMITERLNSSLRFEFFNLPNRANFGNPQANISVPATVGQITGTSTAARTIQFGLRLEF